MKKFIKILLSTVLVTQSAFADYTTTKRIDALDIIQGTKSQENYIKNSPPKAGVTKGWVCYADAAGSKPVDGTGGSPTGVTWTATSTSPIKGPGAFVFTKTGAANKQGMGCSYNFTIDAGDKAKVLDIDVEYMVGSGTFTAGSSSTDSDVIFYLYNITDGSLVEPSSYKLLSSSTTLSDNFRASFQTSSTSTSYRLIAHIATTTTNDFTLKFGDISVAKSRYTYGTPITDWTTYTPLGSWTTNSTYTGRWRRVGDSMEGLVSISTSGAPTATGLTVDIPVGYTIDTAKHALTGSAATGFGQAIDSGTVGYNLQNTYSDSNSVILLYQSAITGQQSQVNATAPFTFGSGDIVNLTYRVPITGWSSSVQMSSDSGDQRIILASASGNPTSATSGNPFIFPTADIDTTGSYNTSTGGFTAPSSGYYRVSISANINTANGSIYIYKNASLIKLIFSTSTTDTGIAGIGTVYANAGDILDVRPNTTMDIITGVIEFKKESGPSAIAANETLNLSYANTAGTSIANSGDIAVPFATREFDTHGSFVTDTFTAPMPGKYKVDANILFASSTYASGNRVNAVLYKNGSYFKAGSYTVVQGAITANLGSSVSTTVSLVTGDTLQIRVANNRTAGATSLESSAGFNFVNISKVGN